MIFVQILIGGIKVGMNCIMFKNVVFCYICKIKMVINYDFIKFKYFKIQNNYVIFKLWNFYENVYFSQKKFQVILYVKYKKFI